MSIADDIINGVMPDFDRYKAEGISLDDMDEYGYTPLIETAITHDAVIAKALLDRYANVNIPDVTGRTPLHWAVDNNVLDLVELFLSHGANPNAYTKGGLSILVYPLMRQLTTLKHILYRHGAKIDFALDFIHAKSIGHRFELKGRVDILTADEQFIEVDYEGFMLEFTVEMIKDSLRRFISSYSTRHLRHTFPPFQAMLEAMFAASDLLQLQRHVQRNEEDYAKVAELIANPLLILPAASHGHAMGFVRYKHWWAKIDRGENSKQEGTVNIYRIGHPERIDVDFIEAFLFKRQPREFFHQAINKILDLTPIMKLPISPQIAGNCSWSNIQALVPTVYVLWRYEEEGRWFVDETMDMFAIWLRWDQDRTIDETIQRFYVAPPARQASIASMLASVLFHVCDAENPHDLKWAEQIVPILMMKEFKFILNSYLEAFCIKKFTRKGNNLLKLLDDCGVNPDVGVTPIATGLKKKSK